MSCDHRLAARPDDPRRTEGELPARAPLWGYRELLLLAAVALLTQLLVTALVVAVARSMTGLEPDEAFALVTANPLFAVPVQLLFWLPVVLFMALVVSARYRMSLSEGLAWNRLPGPFIGYVLSLIHI